MIIEKGTGVFIGKDEDDGRYNAVDHPQANIHKYAKFNDPKPLPNALPDIDWAATVDLFLTDENGIVFTDVQGVEINL